MVTHIEQMPYANSRNGTLSSTENVIFHSFHIAIVGKGMTESSHRERALHEGLITALAVGGFFIIVGVVFGLTPGITGAIRRFLQDLTGVTYPAINGSIVLPAPAHPAAHLDFYQAVFNFMLAIGVLQIVILAARL